MTAAGPSAALDGGLGALVNHQGGVAAAAGAAEFHPPPASQYLQQLPGAQPFLATAPHASSQPAPQAHPGKELLQPLQQLQQYGAYDLFLAAPDQCGGHKSAQLLTSLLPGAHHHVAQPQYNVQQPPQPAGAAAAPVPAASAVTGAVVSSTPGLAAGGCNSQQPAAAVSPVPPAAADADVACWEPQQQQEDVGRGCSPTDSPGPACIAVVSPTNAGPGDNSSSPTPETFTEPVECVTDHQPAAAETAAETAAAETPAAGAGDVRGRFRLLAPCPLPPPDESEGPEAAAEHSRYMQRWEQGSTLAQRWYRLSQRGVLGDIVEGWEEWQHDRLLQGLQAQNKLQAAAAASGRPSRKHRRGDDLEAVDMDAPRQTRTRRVPTALQDYHTEAVIATGTPEPPMLAGSRAPAAQQQQQQLHAVAVQDAGMSYQQAAAARGGAAGAAGAGGGAGGHQTRGGNRQHAGAGSQAQAKAQLMYAQSAMAGHQQQYMAAQYQQQHLSRAYEVAPVSHQQQQHFKQGSSAGAAARAGGLDHHRWQQHQQAAAANYAMQHQHQQYQAAAAAHHHHQQQQQNGYQHHPGAFVQQQAAAGVAGEHHMAQQQQLYASGSAAAAAGGGAYSHANNNTAGAPAPAAGVPVSTLPQALAAAGGLLPPGVDYEAAWTAFTKVLGRVDPLAFTQHFSQAMQQQQQQRMQ